jgi:hypothetical protein
VVLNKLGTCDKELYLSSEIFEKRIKNNAIIFNEAIMQRIFEK